MGERSSVVLVGCGAPLRSMGWYHAAQLLDEERGISAKLQHVVEPWFMSEAGKTSPGSEEFYKWKEELEKTNGVTFFASVKDVPPASSEEKRMAIISARTADNPKLLSECIAIGCKSVYLEKPGAPTVTELESMRDQAKAAGVTVLMGFNKNVSKYVSKARDFASGRPGTLITFVHNNAYENTPESLGECFERNSEGMLKNMAIHELALLVTFYDVSVENIAEVKADAASSNCTTLKGPSGKDFTDFAKLNFSIRTKNGKEACLLVDRCGGDDSVAIVSGEDGKELARYSMVQENDPSAVKKLEGKYPGAMPYFFVQDPDYMTLKSRIAQNCVDGTPAEGVASIDVAVETLKVAEYLTPILQEQLQK